MTTATWTKKTKNNKINNKKKVKGEIGFRTVEITEGGAKPGKDYDHVERIIAFTGNPH